jgi:hypothetical protein
VICEFHFDLINTSVIEVLVFISLFMIQFFTCLLCFFLNFFQNLFDEINTETSKFLVKPGKLIVILKKSTEKEWSDLRKKD